jgi:hypothetical protein
MSNAQLVETIARNLRQVALQRRVAVQKLDHQSVQMIDSVAALMRRQLHMAEAGDWKAVLQLGIQASAELDQLLARVRELLV